MTINKAKIIKITIISAILIAIGGFVAQFLLQNNLPKPSTPYPLANVDITKYIVPNSALLEEPSITPVVSDSFEFPKDFPKSAPIYNYSPKVFFNDININELLTKLNVVTVLDRNDPVLGKMLLAAKDGRSLSVYFDSGEFEYTDEGESDSQIVAAPFSTSLNIDTYKQKSEAYLQSINIGFSNSKYSFIKSTYLNSSGGDVYEVANPQSADMIEFLYGANVDGYPLIDRKGNLSSNSIKIWANSNSEIIKVKYLAVGTVGDKIDEYPLKNKKQVLEDIKNNKAILINGSFEIAEKINGIFIKTISLAYYAVDDKLIPIYILEGVVSTQGISGYTSGNGYLFIEAVDQSKL